MFQTMKSSQPLWNETLYMLINDSNQDTKMPIGIFNHFIVFYSENIKSILNVIKIFDLEEIHHTSQVLEFKAMNDKNVVNYKVICNDEKTASIADFIINSKKNAAEMFKKKIVKKHQIVLHKK